MYLDAWNGGEAFLQLISQYRDWESAIKDFFKNKPDTGYESNLIAALEALIGAANDIASQFFGQLTWTHDDWTVGAVADFASTISGKAAAMAWVYSQVLVLVGAALPVTVWTGWPGYAAMAESGQVNITVIAGVATGVEFAHVVQYGFW